MFLFLDVIVANDKGNMQSKEENVRQADHVLLEMRLKHIYSHDILNRFG